MRKTARFALVVSLVAWSVGCTKDAEKPSTPETPARASDVQKAKLGAGGPAAEAGGAAAAEGKKAKTKEEEWGCGTGQTVCAGSCVYLESNLSHCGRCDNACEYTGEACNRGLCVKTDGQQGGGSDTEPAAE